MATTDSTMTALPFWMDGLTPEIEEKAEKELGETEEVRVQALKELRRRINNETDFRPRIDDDFLLRFLRCKKFDTEVAFKTLRNYYTFKVRYTGLITDFKPSQIKHILEMNMLCPIPWRLPDGSAAAVARIGHFDLTVATPEDLLGAAMVCLELAIAPPATQVCGGSVIFDLDKFGLRHLRHFASPRFLFRLVRLAQDCLPVRIKGIHLVNEPFFISAILNILRSFLSDKIKNRIQCHGSSLKSLHKVFPPEILPKELGGALGPIDNSELRSQLLNKEEFFEKINKYGFHEKSARLIRKRSSRALGLFL